MIKIKNRVGDKSLPNKIEETIRKNKLGNFIYTHKAISGITYFIALYLSGVLSQYMHKAYLLGVSKEKYKAYEVSLGIRCLIEWCTSVRGFITAVIVFTIVTFLIRIFIVPRIRAERGTKEEDRNIRQSENDTYGTSSMGKRDEYEDVTCIDEIENVKGIILGQEKYSNEVITLPTTEDFNKKVKENNWNWDDINNNTRNRNILVIGSPGTLKTRSVIMTSIMQAVRRGESIFVTDPKGDVYEKTKVMLEKHDYKVRAFNLNNMENSDSWNPISTVGDDDIKAKVFAETVITNADENGEQYWNQNSMNFLKACLCLQNTKSFGALYDFITGTSLADFGNYFATRAERKTAMRAFQAFNQCTEVVQGQIINGLGIMIDVFQDDKIRNITDHEEIDLTAPAKEKCAYFVITSDQHRTFDFIAVLFWTMAFITLVEYIDKHRDENGNPTTIPVNMLFDEFSNIGIIPDFTKKISTVRSRNLYITLIIQNLAQLQNRYPNGLWEEIASDCDTTIFLGCNDLMTAEYISKRTGVMTTSVTTENNIYQRDRIALDRDATSREVTSDGQRMVMNPDEILRMKNTDSLLLIRGMKPYLCRKYDYTKHPMAKEIKKISIQDYVPEWRREKEALRLKKEQQEANITNITANEPKATEMPKEHKETKLTEDSEKSSKTQNTTKSNSVKEKEKEKQEQKEVLDAFLNDFEITAMVDEDYE